MAMAVINRPDSSRSATTCGSCGKWPACGYRDLDQKHAGSDLRRLPCRQQGWG